MRDIEETIRCADVVQTAPGECKTLTFYYFTEGCLILYESFYRRIMPGVLGRRHCRTDSSSSRSNHNQQSGELR